jgi:short-subunit dehydrogenase
MTITPTNGKHALVIGVGPGLGAAVARRFSREGFAVTVLARRTAVLTQLADDLSSTGTTVDTVTAAQVSTPAMRQSGAGIADPYLALHTQPADQWTAETVFDGRPS